MSNRLSEQSRVITSILGGWSDTQNLSLDGQFLASVGIDPEENVGSQIFSGGAITPTRFSDFSNGQLTEALKWIEGAPQTAGCFALDANGSLIAYNSTLTSEVGLGKPTNADNGNGMRVYNDYVYCAGGTNIDRWGPISGSGSAFGAGYWVTTLSMSALTDTTYPSNRDVEYPNHVMWPHTDGRLYILDYDGSNGRLHSLTTDADGSNGSGRFNDVTFPPKMMPTDICSWGTDLAVTLIAQGITSQSIRYQTAMLALWDAIPGHRPYRYVPIPDQWATACRVKNGELFVLSGNQDVDTKVLKYLGGYSFQQVRLVNETSPPLASAVDVLGNMLAFGSHLTYPTTCAGVMTLGYRSGRLPSDALNHIARASTSGTLPTVSCLKFLQKSRYPVIGWRDGTPAYGIDKVDSSATYNSVFRCAPEHIGRPFKLRRLTIPLSTGVASGMSVVITVYVDNESVTYASSSSEGGLVSINDTNFDNSEKLIDLQGLTIEGKHNFYVDFTFGGTTEVSILLPVLYEYEVKN